MEQKIRDLSKINKLLYDNLILMQAMTIDNAIGSPLTFFGTEILSEFFRNISSRFGVNPDIKFVNFEYGQPDIQKIYFFPTCLNEYNLSHFLQEPLENGKHIFYLVNYKKHTFVIIRENNDGQETFVMLDTISIKNFHFNVFIRQINSLHPTSNILVIKDRLQFERFSCRTISVGFIYEMEKYFVLNKLKSIAEYLTRDHGIKIYYDDSTEDRNLLFSRDERNIGLFAVNRICIEEFREKIKFCPLPPILLPFCQKISIIKEITDIDIFSDTFMFSEKHLKEGFLYPEHIELKRIIANIVEICIKNNIHFAFKDCPDVVELVSRDTEKCFRKEEEIRQQREKIRDIILSISGRIIVRDIKDLDFYLFNSNCEYSLLMLKSECFDEGYVEIIPSLVEKLIKDDGLEIVATKNLRLTEFLLRSYQPIMNEPSIYGEGWKIDAVKAIEEAKNDSRVVLLSGKNAIKKSLFIKKKIREQFLDKADPMAKVLKNFVHCVDNQEEFLLNIEVLFPFVLKILREKNPNFFKIQKDIETFDRSSLRPI